jgi:hypothetical protein
MKYRSRIGLALTRAYAHGIWRPLICAVIIFIITLSAVVTIDIVTKANVSFGRVIELMLDPGSFSYKDESSTFQLLITIVGAVVFTSLLITTISNMFSNLAESYRNGESDLGSTIKNHILIIGTNQIFYNSLKYLISQKGALVILSAESAKDVRLKISAHIGSDNAERFIIITGDRRHKENLRRVSYEKAKQIFILGENDETDHDAANISCLKNLCKIHKEKEIECVIEIDSPEVLLLVSQTNLDLKNIKLRAFNPEEQLATNLFLNENPDGLNLEYLEKDDPRSHHLIVVGTSSLSTEIAKLYLNLAHYPNFCYLQKRSKLTIIDDNDLLTIGLQSNLKEVCHVHEFGTSVEAKDSFNANEYHDILDFEINHIKGKLLDDHVQRTLTKICQTNDIISVVISSNDTDQNFKDSISLPHYFYVNDYPVFVYQPVTGLIIDTINLPDYFNNLQQFGLNISLEHVSAKRDIDISRAITYAGDFMYDGTRLEEINDSDLDNSVMSNSIYIQRSGQGYGKYIFYLMKTHSDSIQDLYNSDEYSKYIHYAWVTLRLLDGIQMMTKSSLAFFYSRLEDPNDDEIKYKMRMMKIKHREHIDLVSYDMLRSAMKEYSKVYDKRIMAYLYSRYFKCMHRVNATR